jgi:hypothetical protein
MTEPAETQKAELIEPTGAIEEEELINYEQEKEKEKRGERTERRREKKEAKMTPCCRGATVKVSGRETYPRRDWWKDGFAYAPRIQAPVVASPIRIQGRHDQLNDF